jgi:hypothetical protein
MEIIESSAFPNFPHASILVRAIGGAGFSLWGLLLARTNPHRLKPAPLGIRAAQQNILTAVTCEKFDLIDNVAPYDASRFAVTLTRSC